MKRRSTRNRRQGHTRPSRLSGLTKLRATHVGVFAGTTAAALLAATFPVTVTVTLSPAPRTVVIGQEPGQARPECPIKA